MENSLLLSEEQKSTLQDYIQTELLKRGFTAKINSFEETVSRGSNYIEFRTEDFQTVPVIFKNIHVGSFSTSVKEETITREDKTTFEVISVWITVHTRTMTFSNGGNGSELFQFSCKFSKDSERMHDVHLR